MKILIVVCCGALALALISQQHNEVAQFSPVFEITHGLPSFIH